MQIELKQYEHVLKTMPFDINRNIKIFLKHSRNEKDNDFNLVNLYENSTRRDIIILEILEKKQFFLAVYLTKEDTNLEEFNRK